MNTPMDYTPCARCGQSLTHHSKKGTCPDGEGSFTWNLPPRSQLMEALRHIQDVADHTGHPGLSKTASDFLKDLEKK